MSFLRGRDDAIHVPDLDPSQIAPPPRDLYALMGEDRIKELLRDFYRELGRSPIATMFPKDLDKASEKSAAFFIGLLGGPPVYHQTYGNPRMRARHMPFLIDEGARVHWLSAFHKVLENAAQYGIPETHVEPFKAFLAGFSQWMVITAKS